jgi:hypothetical protein
MSGRIIVPHFENESDEADWCFDNRHEHGEIMAKAIEEGRTMNLREFLIQRRLELPRVRSNDD